MKNPLFLMQQTIILHICTSHARHASTCYTTCNVLDVHSTHNQQPYSSTHSYHHASTIQSCPCRHSESNDRQVALSIERRSSGGHHSRLVKR